MAKQNREQLQADERAQHFLKVLIERYIQDGQPVGSRTLARDAGNGLSPATIRNVMSDLEEMGLVASPHTSAGRVPTVSGYRMFVDSLLTLKPLDAQHLGEMEQTLREGQADRQLVLASASSMLSELTHMAGVVMVPRREQVAYRHIEFLPLNGSRILVILVTGDGEVHNRVINSDKPYDAAVLQRATNYLNQTFAGQGLSEVRKRLLSEMEQTREHMDDLMAQVLQVAGRVFEVSEGGDDFVVSGQTNLMDFGELQSMERLRGLFDAFAEKNQILHLLDRCMQADGIQIFIGEESGQQSFDQCSIVSAPYQDGDEVAGVLAVIGPTRMAYDRVIPVVDITAKLLSAALKSR